MTARKDKKGTNKKNLFFGLLIFYAAIFAGLTWWHLWARAIRLDTVKPAYFHDEIVTIRLWTRDPNLDARWRMQPPLVVVRHNGQDVSTIASLHEVVLAYDDNAGSWVGQWPCPWNAAAGNYDLQLLGNEDLAGRLAVKPFRIIRRKPQYIPQDFAIVTLESVEPLKIMRVRAPNGEMKDWRGLLDWAQYVGADAFWMLGGETPGNKPEEIWVSNNFSMFPEVAAECHRRGLKFGLYAMCYLTFSQRQLSRYKYALDADNGHTITTRSISLSDPNRPSDVADLLKKFRDIPDVDYIGLDYIRNALGGYELTDQFYAEMPGVVPPPDWKSFSAEQRMMYFAHKKIARKDKGFIDAWEWWRAHRVGQIVRYIKSQVGDSKPLWAFTLAWEMGHQHGQDPVMMNDAGVDADSIMLYEANKEQYDALIHEWHSYVHEGDVQLIVGDVVDWNLHQKSPDGPQEFYRRMTDAIDNIYSDGPAHGAFIHDLARALHGRLGTWGTRGWMDASARAIKHLKSLSKKQEKQ